MPKGWIESGREKKDGKTVCKVTVPPNCEAQIILPGGRDVAVCAGTYEFIEE